MKNLNMSWKSSKSSVSKLRSWHWARVFYILIIWKGIGFMWKMTFEIFIKSLRFETPWHETLSSF